MDDAVGRRARRSRRAPGLADVIIGGDELKRSPVLLRDQPIGRPESLTLKDRVFALLAWDGPIYADRTCRSCGRAAYAHDDECPVPEALRPLLEIVEPDLPQNFFRERA